MERILDVVHGSRAQRDIDDWPQFVHENRAHRDIDDWPSMANPLGLSKNSRSPLENNLSQLGRTVEHLQGQVRQEQLQVEERLDKLEKALMHSMLYNERQANLENARSHQANGRESPQEVPMPRLDALSTKIEDIQKWRAEVDNYLQVSGHDKEPAAHLKMEVSPAKSNTSGVHHDMKGDHQDHQQHQNHNLPVSFRLCVWDYAFLVGLPEKSHAGSIMVLFLLICSVLFQGFLCLAINDLFTVPVIDENVVREMHEWRMHVAHRQEFMDTHRRVPLARSVCSLETPTANAASHVYDLIATYLPTKEYYNLQQPLIGPLLPYTYHIGIGLSIVACVIWCLRIVEDLDDIFDIVQAVNHLPVHELTEIEFSPEGNKVLAVSGQRRIWYFSILLCETMGLVFLGFTGVAYIINTMELTDLLLNCSALSIVLDVGEYVAHCMPKPFQHMLEGLDPMSRPVQSRMSGAGPETFLKCAGIIAVVIVAIVEMKEGAEILEDARTVICGGNLDFIVDEDASGVLLAFKTREERVHTDFYIEHAMAQLLHNGDLYVSSGFSKEDMSSLALSMAGGPWSFREWTAAEPEESSGFWNSECLDMLPAEDSPYDYSKHFEHILDDFHVSETPISHCSQVKEYCQKTNVVGRRVRQICPVTCACNDPGYKLVLSYGCPDSCAFSTAYNTSMWSRECEDLDVSSPVWSQYHEGLKQFFAQYGENMDDSLAKIKEVGCPTVSNPLTVFGHRWMDPCRESHSQSVFKPLTWACPVSCGCKRHDQHLCPHKCRVGA